MIASTDFSHVDLSQPATLHLWDFGGQDIYHGTHSLFLKSNSIFLVVWDSESENLPEHLYEGLTFKNEKIPYWLTYVKNLGSSQSPVVLIQNKCESASQEQNQPPIGNFDISQFKFYPIQYSAQSDRGRGTLNDRLAAAIEFLHEQSGAIRVGTGRIKVRDKLAELRKIDDSREPNDEKQYRTITRTQFQQFCGEAGGVSSADALLEYLHNCGLIFHRKEILDGQIVLDQSWALDAIYSVLDRKNSYRHIKEAGGRFTRSLLGTLMWGDFSQNEQELFLSMMQSCGICFSIRQADQENGIEAKYIAPDLLPGRVEMQSQIDAVWDSNAEAEELKFEYPFLHKALVRSIVSAFGNRAGDAGIYWQYGLCGYESKTRSKFLIEHQIHDDQSGRVSVKAQNGNSRQLLADLKKIIDAENQNYGLDEITCSGAVLADVRHGSIREAGAFDGEMRESPDLSEPDFEDPPEELQEPSGPVYFVSYAWGNDQDEEGIARKKAINELDERAQASGIKLMIDREQIQVGDRLSKFMKELGKSKQVFVILSDKYLRSPNCMFELFEIWRNSKGRPGKFLKRIKVFRLPCANIFRLSDRLEYVKYWKAEFESLKTSVQEMPEYIGSDSHKHFRLMVDYAMKTDEILSHVADTLLPQSIEEITEIEFE